MAYWFCEFHLHSKCFDDWKFWTEEGVWTDFGSSICGMQMFPSNHCFLLDHAGYRTNFVVRFDYPLLLFRHWLNRSVWGKSIGATCYGVDPSNHSRSDFLQGTCCKNEIVVMHNSCNSQLLIMLGRVNRFTPFWLRKVRVNRQNMDLCISPVHGNLVSVIFR